MDTPTSRPARPATRRAAVAKPDPETIAERAYYLWLDGNADPVANWLRAEAELAAKPSATAKPKAAPRRSTKKPS